MGEIHANSSNKESTGTGFFLDNQGTVVTNYHVIEGCDSVNIQLYNGKTYVADKVLGHSKNKDIAILSTKCTTSVPLQIRKSNVKTGETVYAIGSSLGLGSKNAWLENFHASI